MRTIDDFNTATDKGRFFTVVFVKRTTGDIRVMNCRRNVAKHLKGGEISYDPATHKLMPVWDVGANGYRSVPLDNLLSVRVEGREYAFVDGEFVERVSA